MQCHWRRGGGWKRYVPSSAQVLRTHRAWVVDRAAGARYKRRRSRPAVYILAVAVALRLARRLADRRSRRSGEMSRYHPGTCPGSSQRKNPC